MLHQRDVFDSNISLDMTERKPPQSTLVSHIPKGHGGEQIMKHAMTISVQKPYNSILGTHTRAIYPFLCRESSVAVGRVDMSFPPGSVVIRQTLIARLPGTP